MDACFADAPFYSNDLPNTPTSRAFRKYCLSKLLAFSLEPRCHELCISQKVLRLPVEPTVEADLTRRGQQLDGNVVTSRPDENMAGP